MSTIDHPQHYQHPSGVEAIDICEHLGFNLGNAYKYLARAGKKGPAAEDLRKAAWYLRREAGRVPRFKPMIAPIAVRAMAETVLAYHDRGEHGEASLSLAFRRLLFAIADGHLDQDYCHTIACDCDSEAAEREAAAAESRQ